MRALLIIVLTISLLLQLVPLWQGDEHFEVMPIFTPVSLQYEKHIRDGEKPVNIASAMEILPELERKAERGEVNKQDFLRFRENREKMLELRNKRHELNISMMTVAVEIAQELQPEQWNIIQSQRDSIQAKVEMEIFDDLLRRFKEK